MTKLGRTSVRIMIVFVTIIAVGSIIDFVHRKNMERADLQRMYFFASHGDLEAARKLSEVHSSNAQSMLEKLAQDGRATSDARALAIKALGTSSSLEDSKLANLVDISQPFDVREAAINVFSVRGCGERCMSSTLLALFGLWMRSPTKESSLTPAEVAQRYGVQLDPAESKKIDTDLKNSTERGYLKLLSSNPCRAKQIVSQTYSSTQDFVNYVLKNLPPC